MMIMLLTLHLRRICSSDDLFFIRTKEMKQHLLKRGYTKGCINNAINKASKGPRETFLKENHDQQKLDRVQFVITYNPLLPNFPKLLKDSQIILDASEKCKTVFQTLSLVSYRRARNLNDMLSSKRIPSQKIPTKRRKILRTMTIHPPNLSQINVLNVVLS